MATDRTAPAASTDRLLQLLSLSLSLSSASKAIAKGGGGQLLVRLPDGEFRCRTCGRRFATFQALGGHRTSHRRPRVRADGLELLLGARPGKGAAAAAATAVHRCNACGVVFPTGQALGGHMRRHRAAYEAAAVLEMTTASSIVSEEGDDDIDDEGLFPSTLIQFI